MSIKTLITSIDKDFYPFWVAVTDQKKCCTNLELNQETCPAHSSKQNIVTTTPPALPFPSLLMIYDQQPMMLPQQVVLDHAHRMNSHWLMGHIWNQVLLHIYILIWALNCYSSFDLSSIYAVKYHLTMRICLYQPSFLISTIPGLLLSRILGLTRYLDT